MANPSILIVEDDPFISDMYATKMRTSGFDITVAENGQLGLEAMRSTKFDLILLDVVMPKMDGFEMLEVLKAEEETKNIPVILLTNLGQKDDVERGLKLGAEAYVVKAHFTPAEVIDKVNEVLKGGAKSEGEEK